MAAPVLQFGPSRIVMVSAGKGQLLVHRPLAVLSSAIARLRNLNLVQYTQLVCTLNLMCSVVKLFFGKEHSKGEWISCGGRNFNFSDRSSPKLVSSCSTKHAYFPSSDDETVPFTVKWAATKVEVLLLTKVETSPPVKGFPCLTHSTKGMGSPMAVQVAMVTEPKRAVSWNEAKLKFVGPLGMMEVILGNNTARKN